ncbi:putative uridine kinase [Yarrowia sp. C11]|nr:putative uridine kinase [Yarrowia sp. E02]KAG5371862.1 putative uridine kinase [Yarrowia sp. C11]
MEATYEKLAKRALELYKTKKRRVIISLVGIPGSGKTTSAKIIADKINTISNTPDLSIVVPMDGFHYTRKELDAMEDPVEAHKRRGAPFTFNAQALVDLIADLHADKSGVEVPSFDHAKKDPGPGFVVQPENKILLVEGLYLQLNYEPWSKLNQYIDERWRINIDFDKARERVGKRHVDAGLAENLEQGLERFDMNDGPNGKHLLEKSVEPDVVVESVDESPWAHCGGEC